MVVILICSKKILFILIITFLLIISSSSFSQTTLKQTPCTNNSTCKKLDYFVELGSPECFGAEHIYDGKTDNLVTERPYLFVELVGKIYTNGLQMGYTVTHKCNITKGLCEIDKTSYQKDVDYRTCSYGCLVTPISKMPPSGTEPKTYFNQCLCLAGQVGNIYCDSSKGRHVYYTFEDWTCEHWEGKIVGYCAVGTKCSISQESPDKWQCMPLQGEEVQQISNSQSVGYRLLFPGNLNSAITVAAIQNGKVIASKPISNLSAMEYIAKNGPVNASQALAFAQSTGLTTTLASAKNTVTTPSASITALYNPYKTTTYTPRTTNTYNPYKPTSNTVKTNTRTYTPPTKTYSSYPTVYTRTSTPTASLYAVKSTTPRIVSYATTYTKPTTTTPYYTKRVVNPSSSTVPTRTVAVTNAYKRFA